MHVSALPKDTVRAASTHVGARRHRDDVPYRDDMQRNPGQNLAGAGPRALGSHREASRSAAEWTPAVPLRMSIL